MGDVQLTGLGRARGASEVPVSSICRRVQAYSVQSQQALVSKHSGSVQSRETGSRQPPAIGYCWAAAKPWIEYCTIPSHTMPHPAAVEFVDPVSAAG